MKNQKTPQQMINEYAKEIVKSIEEWDVIMGIDDSLTIVVTWYNIHAGFNLMGLNTEAFEIIGNIHDDNPELLEVSK